MDGKTLALLYQTVQNDNILPVTTVCNVRCAFCSHHQNPPEVKAIAIPHLDPELVDDLLDYLDGSRKIIIGESTSLIMEGEPFTHPRFFEILEAIRRKFPQTLIQIGPFARFDGAFFIFFKIGIGCVDGNTFQGIIHANALVSAHQHTIATDAVYCSPYSVQHIWFNNRCIGVEVVHQP